jgi:rubrerythrin
MLAEITTTVIRIFTGWTCNACGQAVRLDRPHACPKGNNQP